MTAKSEKIADATAEADAAPAEADSDAAAEIEALYRIAVAYAARREASTQMVRQLLQRRLRRKRPEQEQDQDLDPDLDQEPASLIESVLRRLQAEDWVSDERYARLETRRRLRRGESVAYIRSRLSQKGVTRLPFAPRSEEAQHKQRQAAYYLARRLAVGPFGQTPEDPRTRHKIYAAFQRRGFGEALCREVLAQATLPPDVTLDL